MSCCSCQLSHTSLALMYSLNLQTFFHTRLYLYQIVKKIMKNKNLQVYSSRYWFIDSWSDSISCAWDMRDTIIWEHSSTNYLFSASKQIESVSYKRSSNLLDQYKMYLQIWLRYFRRRRMIRLGANKWDPKTHRICFAFVRWPHCSR